MSANNDLKKKIGEDKGRHIHRLLFEEKKQQQQLHPA
jgi:hypothetical protein